MTDNGSCYVDSKVEQYLKDERVVHMINLPHTPQYNGAAESCMKELKKHSMLGKGTLLESKRECLMQLIKALNVMNNYKRYGSKKYMTSQELELCDRPIKRILEREMIYRLLEENGLITITRGRALNAYQKAEVFY